MKAHGILPFVVTHSKICAHFVEFGYNERDLQETLLRMQKLKFLHEFTPYAQILAQLVDENLGYPMYQLTQHARQVALEAFPEPLPGCPWPWEVTGSSMPHLKPAAPVGFPDAGVGDTSLLNDTEDEEDPGASPLPATPPQFKVKCIDHLDLEKGYLTQPPSDASTASSLSSSPSPRSSSPADGDLGAPLQPDNWADLPPLDVVEELDFDSLKLLDNDEDSEEETSSSLSR